MKASAETATASAASRSEARLVGGRIARTGVPQAGWRHKVGVNFHFVNLSGLE
jgi:hypothetical protein